MSFVTRCKKGLMVVMASAIFATTVTSPASAATTYKVNGKTRVYNGKKSRVYYNGKLQSNSLRYGLYYNDNFMIPYKKFLVAAGPKVKSSYNSKTRVLLLTYEKKKIKLTLNSKKIYINGVRKSDLNTAPFQVNMEGSNLIVVPVKRLCAELGLDYSYDSSTRDIYISLPVKTSKIASKVGSTILTAASFNKMSTKEFVSILGPIAQQDYYKTGVLASVTLAQAINESGWGKSGLAQKSNNLFGMKTTLSGNTWEDSAWDGKSYVSVITTEEYSGKKVKITARFRKYASVASSIADHSAYLTNARNGLKRRYNGLTATKSYTKQLQILQKGGYCTWSGYVTELTYLIKRYNLTAYDK